MLHDLSPHELMGLVGWVIGLGFGCLVWYMVILGGSGKGNRS